MNPPTLTDDIVTVLEDLKGEDISVLDVQTLTPLTDTLIVVTGRSKPHVKALSKHVITHCKHLHHRPQGVEGIGEGLWVVVDLGDVVVHIMDPATRDYYQLENLWSKVKSLRDHAGEG